MSGLGLVPSELPPVLADPPKMKPVVGCLGVTGIEVGHRLGACEPDSELDREVLSTPACAAAPVGAWSAIVRLHRQDLHAGGATGR
jgi:hypothetical protein